MTAEPTLLTGQSLQLKLIWTQLFVAFMDFCAGSLRKVHCSTSNCVGSMNGFEIGVDFELNEAKVSNISALACVRYDR